MLWAIICVLILLLGGSVYVNIFLIKKNLFLSDQREELVDRIEESLDILDECFHRLAHNADIPVLSDEPIVREVIADIKRAKKAVLLIAGKVVTYSQTDDE